MNAYREWFRVSLEHDYHGPGRLGGWRAQPDGRSRGLLDAAGAVMRQVPEGFVVFARADRLALLPDEGAEGLLFRVDVDDPHFAAYTLPEAAHGQLLLADSRHAVAEPSGAWRLHPGERLGEEALVAREQAGEAQPAGRLASPRPPSLLLRIAPPLGFDAPDMAADALPRRYVLRFGAAASYWKYYLLDTLAQRSLSVVDLDGEVAFRRVDEDAALGGRAAAVFVSDRAIGLRERSARRFQLREQAAFGDRVLLKRLPVACAGIRRKAQIDGRAVLVSEIFVNY